MITLYLLLDALHFAGLSTDLKHVHFSIQISLIYEKSVFTCTIKIPVPRFRKVYSEMYLYILQKWYFS